MSAAEQDRVEDDFLRPSLQELDAPSPEADKPFELGSQVYVAFFGGPVAAAIVGWQNSVRLRLPDRARSIILGGLVLGIAVTAVLAVVGVRRPSLTLGGFVTYGIAWLVQRQASRAYDVYGGEHESLWGPGGLAVFLGLILWVPVAASTL